MRPDDNTRSTQQKENWYAAIKQLTNLDIPAATADDNPAELEAVINDAVSTLRSRLWKSEYADRLTVHNTDYGFARNFTGLRLLWITFAVLSSIGCWISLLRFDGAILWCVVSTTVVVAAFPLAFFVLPPYVRDKANHYAESFFGAVLELDRAQHHQSTSLSADQ